MKNIIKTINEEISNFDFLGNEKQMEEQEIINKLNNRDLQKQFIYDSILGKGNIKQKNIVDAKIGGDWEEGDEADRLTIEYYLHLSYHYDSKKEPIEFELHFNGDNVGIAIDGYYEEETNSGENWFKSFNWLDIEVKLYTLDGQEINFIEFEKAPIKIRNLFIREYTKPFIETETNLDFRIQGDNYK